MKLYNKIFEAENLDFRKRPNTRQDVSNLSMGEWENQEEVNRDFRELVKRELNDRANIKFDRDGNKYIDLNHLSAEAYKCTDFSDMFNASHYEGKTWTATTVDVSQWDVSRGKNFSNMFRYYRSLNCDLSKWDVSQGKNFYGMFLGCHNFNSDLSNGDVSNGVEFSWMFYGCRNFNSDLSNWNILDNAMTLRMFYDCPIEENFKPKKLQNI